MCVARCQLGLGPSVSILFAPGASVRHPQPGALKTVSVCSCLPPPWLLPRVGTGPLPRPKLPSGSSASPRPRPDGCSTLLGPTPPAPVPDPQQETAWCRCRHDETTLCPRFRLSQSPTPPGSCRTGNVFKNEFANKPTNPTLQKTKTLIFCVPKTVDMLAQHPQDQAVA